MMKRQLALLFLLGPLCSAVAQVVTDTDPEEETPLRRYTVEVIIFRYVEDVSIGSEIFVPDPAPDAALLLDEDGNPVDADNIPVFSDTAAPSIGIEENAENEELPRWIVVPSAADIQPDRPATSTQDDANPYRFVLSTDDQHMLGDALRKFELLDAYETIMHFGWTQPAFPEETTPSIELSQFGRPPEGLDGTLTLYLSRYLHLVVDLALDAPAGFEAEVLADDSFFDYRDSRTRFEDGVRHDPQPVRFRIQEDRILKNGELRYFDHPKFGVLVKVVRVEEEAPDGG